ncbi:RDD family protein [Pelomonas sp. V22]|uniref:RDD family protein n=1 Tax=Pelomonas sp. V22 TaxID=2822139 RepID=UPI0024A9B79F|nr:RDD family protein [Pelomonas sp. V22]MDI4632940.1 RDD family protein [Pelomonas sp. V22]
MTDTTDQRFAPPEAHVADVPSGEVELAGRGTRLLAAIVDGLLLGGVIWAVGMLSPFRSMLLDAGTPSLTELNIGSTAFGILMFLLLQGWPLVTRGQTIAKMLFKLRIVRTDGSKVDAVRMLGLRYGVGFLLGINRVTSGIWGLIDCLLIFRDSRQCLHDSIADTKVIKL